MLDNKVKTLDELTEEYFAKRKVLLDRQKEIVDNLLKLVDENNIVIQSLEKLKIKE